MDELMDAICDARYVLLGEASHGTPESYTYRTAISKRLIEEKGFSFIAVEGDWTDCNRLNRYVKNYEQETGDYVPSLLPKCYDAFIFLDKTKALHPLHIQPEGSEMPETYPFGM